MDQPRALNVTPDRTVELADAVWRTLSRKQQRNVKAVCIDTWQAYETSTQTNTPNTGIVHDRFHNAEYLNEAVKKVRRLEHREPKQTGNDRLKAMRQTVPFKRENLSEAKNDEIAELSSSTQATGRA